mgnify:CR=1 FL=1
MDVIKSESKEAMKRKIERKRYELYNITEEYGMHSTPALRCSEEMDILIIHYQKKFGIKK